MKKLLLIFVLVLAVMTTGTSALAQGTADKDPATILNRTAVNENSLTKANPAGEDQFNDISKHWARESINKVAFKEIFTGSDGKFHPEKAITRSEFVMLLHKALGIQIMYIKAPDIGEFFTDVKNGDAYASALYDLASLGIIDYKGQFRPNDTLTREEMVHFVMRAYEYEMGDSYKQIKLAFKPFADDGKIDPVYSGDILRAEYEGIIKRPANNRFYPKGIATRAQAVTVVHRLVMLLEKEKPQSQEKVEVTPSAEFKDDMLNMKLVITNRSGSRIVINHTSSQKFDFSVLDSNKNILYTWSADKLFMMALSETVIEPGKSAEFTAEVEKDIYKGFSKKAAYVKAYITGTSEDFKINAEGYEAVIK